MNSALGISRVLVYMHEVEYFGELFIYWGSSR
jgi:hypothetical protein